MMHQSEHFLSRELTNLYAHILELGHQQLVIYLFTSHGKRDQIADHVLVNFHSLLLRYLPNHLLHLPERNKGCSLCVRFFNLLLYVFSVSTDHLYKFFINWRVSKEWNSFFSDR